MDFETTADIPIPKNPLERVIGQDDAVRISRIVAKQKRHLLLVGAPGTGKSMIARAIASILPPPTMEVSVLQNPERPERPVLSLRNLDMLVREAHEEKSFGTPLHPYEVPEFVAEKLGFRCRRCGDLSVPRLLYCPSCGADKMDRGTAPFGNLIPNQQNKKEGTAVQATRTNEDGKQETFVYERTETDGIIVLTADDLKKRKAAEAKKLRKIIVPLTRSTFVQVVGNNETELLGDVRHDPYGSHPEIGTPAYQRVVAGALHEAHEGVLYIDEMTTLGEAQKFLLTAMQEKKFPITGRNPNSAGSIVRVENAPCDFILVGAMNINDLPSLSPALRSRIRGSGYEIVLNTLMEDNLENQQRMASFVAQEIQNDGRIPHASRKSVGLIIEESRKLCKSTENKSGLTLRLRTLSGIIRLAGDLASVEEASLIDPAHIQSAIKQSKSAEEQLEEKYGNIWSAGMADYGARAKKGAETA
jgi:ATP-dependent Lon protease